MGEYTFVVNKTCPVCGESTRIVKTKSKLIRQSIDRDYCIHYKDFNPYFYTIWFCEHCGFAAEERTFLAPMPQRHRETLQKFLSERPMNLKFKEVREVPDAVASFKLAIFYAQMLHQSYERQAGLMLELAWVYRASGERDKEEKALQDAADLYDQSLMKERYPINGKTDNFVIYLVGAIYYQLHDVERCTQYLSRLVGNQSVRQSEPQVYGEAQKLWTDIREDKRAAEQESGK